MMSNSEGAVPSGPALLSSRLHLTLMFVGMPIPHGAGHEPNPLCGFQLLGLEYILERNGMPVPPRSIPVEQDSIISLEPVVI